MVVSNSYLASLDMVIIEIGLENSGFNYMHHYHYHP